MKEKELLNSMSEIKDEYIEEASESIKAASDKGQASKKGGSFRLWAGALAAVLVICIGIGTLGTGMFRAGSAAPRDMETMDSGFAFNGAKSASAEAPAESYMAVSDTADLKGESYKYSEANGALMEAEVAEDVYNKAYEPQTAQTKLIKRANVYVQTLDFDATESSIAELVKSVGGYFENSSVNNGGYYSDGEYKYAEYTVRVPADKYDEFLGSVGSQCHVSSISESVEDVGEQYFDVENRLNTLKVKHERLTALLEKASALSDIIELESALSDTEYQMNAYTSTLNRYDSLIGYSTIYISVEKVYRVDDGIQQNNSYFARLLRNLKNGAINFVDGIGDVFSWAAYNLIGIIIIVVVIIICRKKQLFRRLFAKIRRK